MIDHFDTGRQGLGGLSEQATQVLSPTLKAPVAQQTNVADGAQNSDPLQAPAVIFDTGLAPGSSNLSKARLTGPHGAVPGRRGLRDVVTIVT